MKVDSQSVQIVAEKPSGAFTLPAVRSIYCSSAIGSVKSLMMDKIDERKIRSNCHRKL